MTEIRQFTPMDSPLLLRLASRGLILDNAALMQDSNFLESAILSAIPLAGRGRHTFIMRAPQAEYAAQIQIEGARCRITVLAPTPEHYSPWLPFIEALLERAGRRGAYLVMAEVPVNERAFELFRRAGFTVYARQSLFVRQTPAVQSSLMAEQRCWVRPIEDSDYGYLNSLYCQTVPSLVQQVSPPPAEWEGFAVFLEGRLRGCLTVLEGKSGVLMTPHLHPELYDLADEIFTQAMAFMPERRLFVRLMAFQAWLRPTLEERLGFEECQQQALMAKHTVVLREALPIIPHLMMETRPLTPVIEIALESTQSDQTSLT